MVKETPGARSRRSQCRSWELQQNSRKDLTEEPSSTGGGRRPAPSPSRRKFGAAVTEDTCA